MSNILKDYFEDLQEFAPRFVVMASGRKVPIYQLWLADGGSAARYVIYAFGIYALMLTAIGGFDLEAIKLPVLAMSFFRVRNGCILGCNDRRERSAVWAKAWRPVRICVELLL